MISDSLTTAYANGRMTPADKVAFDRYQRLRRYMYSEITATPLIRMNQPDVLDSNRLLHRFDRDVHMRLIRTYANAPDLINWQAAENTFWEERNAFMAKRILTHLTNYPGKRLVVLTGLMHKYYLTDLLSPHKTSVLFRLVDYYAVKAPR